MKKNQSIPQQTQNHFKRKGSEFHGIYHEKQSKELCALHALNNLFQCSSFAKPELDQICQRLANQESVSASSGPLTVNPHKSVLGTGNYDVNVLMTALNKRDMEAVWWDKRKSLNSINYSKVYGFILNVDSWMSWGVVTIPIKRKHWIAVRQINGMFVNLDSKLKQPEVIGQTDGSVRTFLAGQLDSKQAEMLLVVDKTTYDKREWELQD